MRDENAQRQIGNDAGVEAFLDANVAVAVLRFSDHRPAEIKMLAPHQVFIPITQFGARHRPAIAVVAAFVRIPGMSSGGAVEQHHRRRQHANMLGHL